MLRVHFLNVGHGDCTIIEHPDGRITVIDINNGSELDPESVNELWQIFSQPLAYISTFSQSKTIQLAQFGYKIQLTNPVAFLKQVYPNRSIFRYIQTHPDLDHMRGLAALRYEGIDITNFWDTQHYKSPDFWLESDKSEWQEYTELRSGRRGTKVLQLYRGSQGNYWNQNPQGFYGGDGIEILSPTPALVQAMNKIGNTNNLSYVLRLTYAGRRIIFGGDAEDKAWDEIGSEYSNDLKCDILKASHHGRDSGYYQKAVKLMSPEYTIVSVGKKPSTDASNKYRNYSENVWSTRWLGNITLTIYNWGEIDWKFQYDR